MWGHAQVIISATDGITPGDRFFGFWPMSTDVMLRPVGVGARGFIDGADHRTDLPAIYNRYQRAPNASAADAEAEARTALIRPLFATSFLIEAWLADENMFGAESVVLTSASSKTALGLAHLLSVGKRAEVVGLTSSRNAEFVTATGAYDRVVTYDDLRDGLGDGRSGLDDRPAVLVDFAGNPELVAAVHNHYRDRLRRSVAVGFTHQSPSVNEPERPGPAPEFFFAPDHIQRRTAEWGGAGMAERIDAARKGFDAGPGQAMEITERIGSAEIVRAWEEAVDGLLDPRHGIICSW